MCLCPGRAYAPAYTVEIQACFAGFSPESSRAILDLNESYCGGFLSSEMLSCIIRFTKAGELGPNKLFIFFVRGYLEGPKYGPLTYALGTQVTV